MTFDKDKYWENRKDNKRGQGVVVVQKAATTPPPDGATLSFGNDGTLVVKNRAYRRQTIRLFAKSSQLRKKGKRKKN